MSSFRDLLYKGSSVSVHVKNIKTLAIEMFKVSNKLTIPLMNEIFVKRNNAYNLRKPSEFVRPKTKTKNLKTISAFKRELKNLKLENCPCRLCKTYTHNVGFI